MDFDLTTPDTAYAFVLWMTGLSGAEFTEKYIAECGENFDAFWDEVEVSADDVNILLEE